MTKKMLRFGVKNNLGGLPWLIVVQTVSLILASVTGPAALAIYSRPLALTRHTQVIVDKFANILISTTASLHGLGGQEAEIRAFFITGTRLAFSVTLPLLLVVALYGDVIVRVWMGNDYVDPVLAPLLAAGLLLPYANTVAMRVLVGLNAHGRIAIVSLAACLLAMILGVVLAFAAGWSPRAAAAIVGASLTIGPGIIVPLGACWRLRVGVMEYARKAFGLPLACNLPFAAILAVPRLYSSHPSVMQSLTAFLIGAAALATLYWLFVLERPMKQHLLARLRVRFRTVEAYGD